MSVINNVEDVVFSGGRHRGQSMGEVGKLYTGYGYILYRAREGDENAAEYLVKFPVRPAATWEECKSFELQFGKHKGKKVHELMDTYEGRAYLGYLGTWNEFSELEMVRRVVNEFGRLPPPRLETADFSLWEMPFGKYKGTKLVDMVDVDYMKYLLKKMDKEPTLQNQFMGARLRFILANRK